MSLANRLKRAREAGETIDPPDGRWNVQITDASAFAGNDGREWAKLTLKITNPGHQLAGAQFEHFHNLNNEVGLRLFEEAILTYGVPATLLQDDQADLEDFSHALFELVDTQAVVSVSHNAKGFAEIRVVSAQTALSDITPPATAANGAGRQQPVTHDDIPF